MRAAAESLVHCLLEMGEMHSNPVLEVIQHQATIQQEIKYPAEHLQFSGTGWRAYYHTHANNSDINHLFKSEHGHFHIFVKDKTTDSWSHLVALSMDEFGQPLRWFMVNHWVTSGTWLDAATLIKTLESVPFAQQNSLLEVWLLSLLSLYKTDIKDLLLERDKTSKINNNEAQRPDQKQNREMYLLAEKNIVLKEKLEKIFINNN